MFKKILIANRGEIAVRIIKTCRKMKIKTVAVYSEADTNSLAVDMADEAVYIGQSPADQSYLNIKSLVNAAAKSGAEAVHPGYGFLSENASFARALEKTGITFIGPSPTAIKKMGDKIESKKLAQAAGVSTVPGHMGIIKDATEAAKIAAEIGFPVMVKAAAGGGGKGMRVVRNKSEMAQAFSSATNEAKNSFKDSRIFLEKFIERPRHIEIQVIADSHGNIVCLGERECSIQRHNQKVIEEAPSPFVDEKTRAKMYKQVVSLAEKVGYTSAGTVEFIVDQSKNFYFLEMNTRLQVEHPVTELVTGLDIVELMIRIAAGEKLPFAQKDIKLNGWAIESRIYAEDPSRGFLPSSGRIIQYRTPEESDNVRIDSGVFEGGEVSMFYDPMIAKLCTYGETRADAINEMQGALGNFLIRGISHNISFLEAVMAHPRFASGDISTNFIAEEYPEGFFGAELNSDTTKVFIAVGTLIYLRDAKRATSITGQTPGRERQIGTRWVVSIDDDSYPITIREKPDGYVVKYERQKISVESAWILGNRLFQGTVDDKPVSVIVEYAAGGFMLTHSGSTVKVTVRTPRVAELTKFMPKGGQKTVQNLLMSPISGLVVAVKVEKGEEVKAGQELAIIEAMKMENIITAEHDAKIAKIHIKAGDQIQANQMVMEFE